MPWCWILTCCGVAWRPGYKANEPQAAGQAAGTASGQSERPTSNLGLVASRTHRSNATFAGWHANTNHETRPEAYQLPSLRAGETWARAVQWRPWAPAYDGENGGGLDIGLRQLLHEVHLCYPPCGIGAGGGRVFRGFWNGSTVAVKLLVSDDIDALHHSAREAMLSRIVSHPHLVQCYSVCVTQLTPEDLQPETYLPKERSAQATAGAAAGAPGGRAGGGGGGPTGGGQTGLEQPSNTNVHSGGTSRYTTASCTGYYRSCSDVHAAAQVGGGGCSSLAACGNAAAAAATSTAAAAVAPAPAVVLAPDGSLRGSPDDGGGALAGAGFSSGLGSDLGTEPRGSLDEKSPGGCRSRAATQALNMWVPTLPAQCQASTSSFSGPIHTTCTTPAGQASFDNVTPPFPADPSAHAAPLICARQALCLAGSGPLHLLTPPVSQCASGPARGVGVNGAAAVRWYGNGEEGDSGMSGGGRGGGGGREGSDGAVSVSGRASAAPEGSSQRGVLASLRLREASGNLKGFILGRRRAATSACGSGPAGCQSSRSISFPSVTAAAAAAAAVAHTAAQRLLQSDSGVIMGLPACSPKDGNLSEHDGDGTDSGSNPTSEQSYASVTLSDPMPRLELRPEVEAPSATASGPSSRMDMADRYTDTVAVRHGNTACDFRAALASRSSLETPLADPLVPYGTPPWFHANALHLGGAVPTVTIELAPRLHESRSLPAIREHLGSRCGNASVAVATTATDDPCGPAPLQLTPAVLPDSAATAATFRPASWVSHRNRPSPLQVQPSAAAPHSPGLVTSAARAPRFPRFEAAHRGHLTASQLDRCHVTHSVVPRADAPMLRLSRQHGNGTSRAAVEGPDCRTPAGAAAVLGVAAGGAAGSGGSYGTGGVDGHAGADGSVTTTTTTSGAISASVIPIMGSGNSGSIHEGRAPVVAASKGGGYDSGGHGSSVINLGGGCATIATAGNGGDGRVAGGGGGRGAVSTCLLESLDYPSGATTLTPGTSCSTNLDQVLRVFEELHGMGAAPGRYLTAVLMEYCERGTLLDLLLTQYPRQQRHNVGRSLVPRVTAMHTRYNQPHPPQRQTADAAGSAAGSVQGPAERSGGRGGGGTAGPAGPSATWQTYDVLCNALEIAQGMAYLHSLNLVHGDLKPANVLIKGCAEGVSARGYTCKISDFGLTNAVTATSRSLSRGRGVRSPSQWGALAYMAPEVAAGRCGKAADVYSFGALLWHMVSGEPPYAHLHPAQLLVGLVGGDLHLEWPPGAHPIVRRLGEACMARDPPQRPEFDVIVRVLRKAVRRAGKGRHPHRGASPAKPTTSAASAAAAAAAGGALLTAVGPPATAPAATALTAAVPVDVTAASPAAGATSCCCGSGTGDKAPKAEDSADALRASTLADWYTPELHPAAAVTAGGGVGGGGGVHLAPAPQLTLVPAVWVLPPAGAAAWGPYPRPYSLAVTERVGASLECSPSDGSAGTGPSETGAGRRPWLN